MRQFKRKVSGVFEALEDAPNCDCLSSSVDFFLVSLITLSVIAVVFLLLLSCATLTEEQQYVREDALITIASADTLDAAAWRAVEEMRRIVTLALNVDEDEARILVGVLGNVRVSQIVNPKKTARVEMPLVKTADGWEIKV